MLQKRQTPGAEISNANAVRRAYLLVACLQAVDGQETMQSKTEKLLHMFHW